MNDLIARLIAAGTPTDLVAEVAMELGRAQGEINALEKRRATEAANSARYRQRGGGQVPGWLRQQIFERDGHRCVDCCSEERLEIDHVTPLSKGGDPTDPDNLQTLCKTCNARKKDRIRKQDERGQVRTNQDKFGQTGTKAESSDKLGHPPSPTPSPSFPPHPQTNPTPAPTPGCVSTRAREANPFPKPEGVDPQHWADFLNNRKRKRLPNTATAHRRLMQDIARLADDEWPPGRLIEHAAARGWAAIYDPRQDNRYDRHSRHRPANDEIHDPMVRAIIATQAERAARSAAYPGGDAGCWPEDGE